LANLKQLCHYWVNLLAQAKIVQLLPPPPPMKNPKILTFFRFFIGGGGNPAQKYATTIPIIYINLAEYEYINKN